MSTRPVDKRFRLSRDPSVETTLSVMPLRFRIFWYCWAAKLNRLPGTPAAMVRVFGGAGRTKCKAANMTMAPITITGPTECAKSHRKTRRFCGSRRDRNAFRGDARFAAGISASIALLTWPIFVDSIFEYPTAGAKQMGGSMSRTKQHLITTLSAARTAPAAKLAAPLLACIALTGCSLLTIKSPEIPLTPREQEARLLTRDYAAHFATTTSHLIDDVARENTDPAIRLQALRLKLGAVTEITRASTGLSPMGSLLDTWTFSLQFRDFLTTGSGANLLGSAQPAVSRGAAVLGDEVNVPARKVSGSDYSRYRTFVSGYAERNPLQNADMVRPSVLSAWMLEESDKNPLRAEGTVAQALGDVSDRMRIYSERVPAMSLWQAELALNRAGFDDASYRTAFHNIDAQLERISKLADTSPELAHEAI